MGSVHYLPPEQASGKGSTLKSDIYSMGILMYELLVGQLPYRGDNAVEIALKHLKEPLPSIRDELPDIPQSVENVILKSAAKNPKNRYNDAREMYEDLKTCLDESRLNEPKLEYQYPELDSDNKKFTKQVEKAISVENSEDEDEAVSVKQIKDEDIKKENKLLIVLSSIFVGLIVVVAAIVLFIPSLIKQKDIKVPDVSNMDVTKAIETLQNVGFEVSDDQLEISDDKVPEGKVVKTNPASGSKRTKGTIVKLYISTGDSQITVEDYTGKNYLEVKGALEAYDISVLIEKKEVDDKNITDGNIIGQDVAAGEKLSAGDTITLYIPNVVTKYPDFTDGSYTIDDVQKFCDQYGVKLKIVYDTTTSYNAGTIFQQSRDKGYTVMEGTTFTITVAKEAENSDSQVSDGDCDEEMQASGMC